MPLLTRIVRQPLVSDSDRESMLELYKRYFDNVRRDRFFAELAEKDWVIQLHDREVLAGFSTQRVIRLPVGGRNRYFLFSGDTIVDRAYWREQSLAGAFGHLMLRTLRDFDEEHCHWFLLSKGHRTYRYLPVFFERFIPAPDQPERADLRVLLNAIASFKCGPAYDPATGIVKAGRETDRLRPEYCEPPARQRTDAHVAFFLERNPRFTQGDELACLAEIRRDNLNRMAWRVIERSTPEWVE